MSWGCGKHEWDAGSENWNKALLELCERQVANSPRTWGMQNSICPSCYVELLDALEQAQKELDKDLSKSQLRRLNVQFEDALKQANEQLEAANFWNNWVYPDGASAEDVQNELADYRFVMQEAAKVYDNLTRGRISKPNTKASAVISVVEEIIAEESQAANERIVELKWLLQNEPPDDLGSYTQLERQNWNKRRDKALAQ